MLQGMDAAFRRPSSYRHPAGRIRRVETHISVVYLAGRYAYKLIKPVALGFADFTALSTRKRCCEAQVRLNRPLADALYFNVLPIARRARSFSMGASGKVVEYAVRMRRFDEAQLFACLAQSGELTSRDIDQAAQRLAGYHRRAPRDIPAGRFGRAALLRAQVDAVGTPLLAHCSHLALPDIHAWYTRQFEMHAATIERRRAEGFVRSCHGDLHLDNVVRWRNRILMFDCIDFDDALRWIDVANDLAFLVMDLHVRAGARLANRLLNRWLESTGDYEALALMRLFMVYRALVRAWMAYLKGVSASSRGTVATPRNTRRYLDFASTQIRRQQPVLLLCHGYSGSGKSVASRALAEVSGAIRLSSDAERKRLNAPVNSDSRLMSEHYTREARGAIYDHLYRLASRTLQNGYSVIVDATFLERSHRREFLALADSLGAPACILDFHAEPAVLVQRIEARMRGPRDASDADVATLTAQLASAKPLSADEQAQTFVFDTAVPPATFDSPDYWSRVLVFMRRAAEPQAQAL